MARQAERLILGLALPLACMMAHAAYGQTYTSSLTPRGWSYSAKAVINGSLETDLVVDSGSSFTIISSAAAKRLGIKNLESAPRYPLSAAGGTVWVRLALLERMNVGGAQATDVEGAVADLPSFKGADGLLGKSFLDRFIYRLNGRTQLMELSIPTKGPLYGQRGEVWWRGKAQYLENQARLFRAMERGVDASMQTGDLTQAQLKEKLSREDAARLAVYFEGLLERLRREAAREKAPEKWVR